LALVIGFTTLPAFAQSTSTVQDTISDSSGGVLPGVTVTVRNVATADRAELRRALELPERANQHDVRLRRFGDLPARAAEVQGRRRVAALQERELHIGHGRIRDDLAESKGPTGNPIGIVTNITTFTGVNNSLRPDLEHTLPDRGLGLGSAGPARGHVSVLKQQTRCLTLSRSSTCVLTRRGNQTGGPIV